MCDTSVVLHLTEANALPLLSRMGDVSVPRAVDVEMTQNNPLWKHEKPPWVRVRALPAKFLKEAAGWLQAGLLDAGEAEQLL